MKSIASAVPVLVLLIAGCFADRPAPRAESSVERASESDTVAPPPEQRRVAFTFDDLPMSRDGTYGLKRMQEVTSRLLAQIERADITAVGFVNEIKLGRGDAPATRIALLEQWLDAGMELGNHT